MPRNLYASQDAGLDRSLLDACIGVYPDDPVRPPDPTEEGYRLLALRLIEQALEDIEGIGAYRTAQDEAVAAGWLQSEACRELWEALGYEYDGLRQRVRACLQNMGASAC